MVYFDNAATTKMSFPVFEAMKPYLLDLYANPSSSYRFADFTKQAIKQAREQCAKAINADPEQIIFTSGATESNNLIIMQAITLFSPYEHPSMRAGMVTDDIECHAKYCELKQIIKQSCEMGIISSIKKYKKAGVKNAIVSYQYVNNEIGTIFPVNVYADITHKADYRFHTDATQAFSHVPIDVKDLDCDFLSLSGHKFHAPKGIGLLYVKEPHRFDSPIIGGGQERGLRSGTENVANIVGLGKAMELYNYSPIANERIKMLKDRLINRLKAECPCEFRINRIPDLPTVDNIISVSFKDINGEGLAILLDYDGFCVSQGSACHSGSSEPSKVLKAIGVPEEYIRGTIRISFSKDNTINEVDAFVDCVVNKLKALNRD